jgi:pantoate--beta-alanine ligase
VVRKMITDLCFDTTVLVAPTVRDADGLVLTVRNQDLTTAQRQEVTVLHRALLRAKEMVGSGVRSTDRVIAEVTHLLGELRRVRVIYVAIVDPATMEPLREVTPGRSLLAVAVWIDEVRLIDNLEL